MVMQIIAMTVMHMLAIKIFMMYLSRGPLAYFVHIIKMRHTVYANGK